MRLSVWVMEEERSSDEERMNVCLFACQVPCILPGGCGELAAGAAVATGAAGSPVDRNWHPSLLISWPRSAT